MKELFVLTTASNSSPVELFEATEDILEPGETLLFVYPLAVEQPSSRLGNPANHSDPTA
jgi:hypothetical protein